MRNVTRTLQVLMVVILSVFVFAVQSKAQTTLFTEDFETAAIGQTPPAGWGVDLVSGGNYTYFYAAGTYPTCTPASGVRMVEFGSFSAGSGTENRLKRTTSISTVGYTNLTVDFKWLTDPGYAGVLDLVNVQYSTNGTTWTTVATVNRYAATQVWTTQNINLPAGAQGQATLYIAFDFVSQYGNNCHLDLVHIMGVGPPPPSTITVGTGTNSCQWPYSTYWMGGRTQMLYSKASIQAAGGSAGMISAIGFNVLPGFYNQTMINFQINFQQTAATALTGWINSGWTNAYTGSYAVTNSGWQMITLQTPYLWDGSGNLLIEVCYGSNGSYTYYSFVYGTTTTNNTVYHYEMDNQTGCTMTSGAAYNNLPNLQFIEQPYVGTLTGTVTSCYNNATLAGVTVTCNGVTGTTNGVGVYTLYNVPIGTGVTANYTLLNYLPGSAVVNIGNNQTTTQNICLSPIPGYLAGVVTSAATGNPIIGASISVNTVPPSTGMTYGPLPSNGYYKVSVYPVGTFSATYHKDGFIDQTWGPFTFTQNNTITKDVALLEAVNAPSNVVATLNAAQTSVTINWGVPSGNYELLNDDGQFENFTVWATAGNFDAVKFTPVGYPATLNGGKINIGSQSANYPSGSNPLVPFQLLIYDATGANGTPGAVIAGPFDYTPAGYNWNTFTFTPPITITSGSFYIVKKQGGAYPNAAGTAVDTTTIKLLSWQKFNPNGPWVPISGNFAIRASMYGPGGPVPLLDAPQNTITASYEPHAIYATRPSTHTGVEGKNEVIWQTDQTDNNEVITGYQVWRLLQGQEGTPAAWISVGTTTNLTMVDNSWPTLPCNPYRWSVEAQYTGNRWSNPAFSNAIGKCWTASVTIHVDITCLAQTPQYTTVKLQNTVYTDTIYFATLDTSGTVTFPHVWKGTYTLTVKKFGYTPYIQTPITIMGDMTINVMLLQIKTPPSGLYVNVRSLRATWHPPRAQLELLNEAWTSGGFAANGWTVNPASGSNWSVTAGLGNPAPSLQFYWSPTLTNYNQYVTSKVLTGMDSPSLLLKYDIYLNNFSTATVESMAVELWNGTSWVVLKSYTNSGGSFPWTSESLDISSVTHQNFQIRFHASGPNSYNLNNWNIDNILIVGSDGSTGPNPCVLGYNFYLNNVLSGFTLDTTYTIPPNQCVYGQTYTACVNAVYGSGYSAKNCTTFVSKFLYPPTQLVVVGIENAAYLTWHKPQTMGDIQVLDVQPRNNVAQMASQGADVSPMEITTGGYNYTDALWDVLFSWNCDQAACPGIEQDANAVYTSSWQSGYGAPPWFHKYNKMTGAVIEHFDCPGATAVRDMASDNTFFYGAAASNSLYKMNFATHTLVATITASTPSGIRHIAWDQTLDNNNGGFWCGGWTDMVAIKMDGSLLYTGPAVNNVYGDAWDNNCSNGPYLWTFSQSGANLCDLTQYKTQTTAPYLVATGLVHDAGTVPGFVAGSMAGGLCLGNVSGKTALIGNIQQNPNLIFALELCAGGPGPGLPPPGLIGYNIYRSQGGTGGPWNLIKHMVPGPDTLHYYDMNLDPGKWCYRVTAYYDLTPYGFPGQFDESLPEGPQCVTLVYGHPLPFCEDWSQGTFVYNGWGFVAPSGQGNWSINTGQGNPAPGADFSWQPVHPNGYSFELESPVIDASAWTCASIWLDYDYQLIDRNQTSNEKLDVEVYFSGAWHQKEEYVNNGTTNWIHKHIDISAVKGKAFRIGFKANGAHSDDILHWYVDNVCATGVCTPPTALAGTAASFNVTLTWTPPACGGGGQVVYFIFDDGSAENGWGINPGYIAWIGNEFPIATTLQGVLQGFSYYWMNNTAHGADKCTIDVFDGSHTLVGSSGQFTIPNDAWDSLTVTDIPFAGMFYAMVKWNMNTGQTNWLGIDENGPYSSQDLEWYYDGTTWAKIWVVAGVGNPGVMLLRAKAFIPGDLKSVELIPGSQPTTIGTYTPGVLTQSHRAVDTKNYQQMGIYGSQTDSSALMGYNVYRTDRTGALPFTKLNASPVTATTYVDVLPANTEPGATFKYYVTDVFNDSRTNLFLCESSSDTITILWPAVGIDPLSGGEIRIYPNPAKDKVTIESSNDLKGIEMLNFLGQKVYSNPTVEGKKVQVNVSTLQSGVYFVKVVTEQGNRTVKITVTR